MKTLVYISFLACGAVALNLRTTSCCFNLTAVGGLTGPVGQLDDGQNRVGQGLPPATYCISNGGVTDRIGRGCILTPPTTQFQCDAGANPMEGFVSCDGTFAYSDGNSFFACPTGDNGGFNIYSVAPAGQQGCVPVNLDANACRAKCPSTSPSPSPPPPSPPPEPSSCPADLNGNYQFPHLIVPVDSANPTAAPGTTYNGQITPTISTIFNFDIPGSYSGKTCSLVFLFPEQSDLQTASYAFSGSGQIDFSMLDAPATPDTSFANAPPVKTDYGITTVAPGNSYIISTFSCPASQTVAYELKSAGGGTSLTYFQDYNPSPIGLYITQC